MSLEQQTQAARNNALWYDTIFRTHGRPGEWRDHLWNATLRLDNANRPQPDILPRLDRAHGGRSFVGKPHLHFV
jgi:hypothetical protein